MAGRLGQLLHESGVAMTDTDDEYILNPEQWRAVRPLFEDFNDDQEEETA